MPVLKLFALFFLAPFVYAQSEAPQTKPATELAAGMEYHEAYYQLEELNSGLPGRPDSIHLQTPQAALEHFITACRAENYDQAAHALNLNLLPPMQQTLQAAQLARKLFYVIEHKVWIDWSDLPDRPDGTVEIGANNDPLVGKPRRSLRLGMINLDGRDISIRLQRIKLPEQDPVWVFAAATVENIDALYARFGPGWLQRNLPDWATQTVLGRMALWEWLALLLFTGLSVGIAWASYYLLQRFLRAEVLPTDDLPLAKRIIENIPAPACVIIGLVSFALFNGLLLRPTGPVAKLIGPALTLLIIAALTWLGIRIIHQFSDYLNEQYADRLEHYEDDEARRALTYAAVARRVFIFVALLAGTGIALSQLNLLKTLGISLLASAGIISVIAGVAAHNVLGNIMAGIQIAITRPASIGDNIYFENQWGYVEEITYTYITIRTWDQRRIIVPLKYFLSHPFENWSMHDSHLIKPIYMYVDYRLDVQKLRDKFEQLLKDSEDWDEENPPTVQVTGLKEETMEVRALCSAKNPSVAWDLHCYLREELIKYIQAQEDGRYLPKRRLVLDKDLADDE